MADPAAAVGVEVTRVLGQTRAADLVIRLAARPGWSIEQLVASSTYRHEWIHYLQFSSTAVGILLSTRRRGCVTALANELLAGLAEGEEGRRRAHLFLDQLDRLQRDWGAWEPDWWVGPGRGASRIGSVRGRPEGLMVTLEDRDEPVRLLPIGPHQVFEAWAWLVETCLAPETDPIPRLASQLVYTWPLWLLAERQEVDIDDLDLDLAAVRLLPVLFAATFYDADVLAAGGSVSDEVGEIAAALSDRRVSCGRLVWQMVRDLAEVERGTSAVDGVDRYLARLGLPRLTEVLSATQKLVASMRRADEHERDRVVAVAEGRDAIALDLQDWVQAEVLETTAHNLDAVVDRLDDAMTFSLHLPELLRAPVCAIEVENHHLWASVRHGEGLESREATDTRTLLRQQLVIFEHVLYRLAYGDHLACHGSPEWARPINPCPDSARCLQRRGTRGLEICTDDDWRRKVAMIVGALHAGADVPLTDADIPGIEAALAAVRAAQRAPDTTIDVEALGLRVRPGPDERG